MKALGEDLTHRSWKAYIGFLQERAVVQDLRSQVSRLDVLENPQSASHKWYNQISSADRWNHTS
eukprot:854228-Amphidinium_carterae.1